jgi:hypothetical protein
VPLAAKSATDAPQRTVADRLVVATGEFIATFREAAGELLNDDQSPKERTGLELTPGLIPAGEPLVVETFVELVLHPGNSVANSMFPGVLYWSWRSSCSPRIALAVGGCGTVTSEHAFCQGLLLLGDGTHAANRL